MKLAIICTLVAFTKASPISIMKVDIDGGGISSNITEEVNASSPNPPVLTMRDGHIDVWYDATEANIELPDGFQDYRNPIASYSVDSQLPGYPTVFFELRVIELYKGIGITSNLTIEVIQECSEQTKEAATFRATMDSQQQVNIYLVKPMKYEKVQSYTLTLQVRNNADLVAETTLNVRVRDDKKQAAPAPLFTNWFWSMVLEHEAPGTFVMRVYLQTYPNNKVTYSISDENQDILDKFNINPDTGVITTKVELDREERDAYAMTIIAMYGEHGEEGWVMQMIHISIASYDTPTDTDISEDDDYYYYDDVDSKEIECPMLQYNNSNGECQDCHRNCEAGCNGPANYIGLGGCNSCHKAIINTVQEVVECRQENEPCPQGYLYTPQDNPQDSNLPMSLLINGICHLYPLPAIGQGQPILSLWAKYRPSLKDLQWIWIPRGRMSEEQWVESEPSVNLPEETLQRTRLGH